MTREKLLEIAADTIKVYPKMTYGIARVIHTADEVIKLGLYTSDYAYEEAYKSITYEKAKQMTNDIFREAGMPI